MARLAAQAMLALGVAACTETTPMPPAVDSFVQTEAGRLFARTVGSSGDTIVVVPGGPPLGAQYLEELLTPLARRGHTLIFYDPRGRGRSDALRDTLGYTLESDLADLDAVRKHFGLSRPLLIAHHYGAAVGAVYAMRSPDKVRRLALLSPLYPRQSYVYDLSRIVYPQVVPVTHAAATPRHPVGGAEAECLRYWGLFFPSTPVVSARALAQLGPAVCAEPAPTLAGSQIVLRSVLRSLGARWDWRDSLRLVRAPVLIVQGVETDTSAGPERERSGILLHAAETWGAHLEDARVLALPGEPLFPWERGSERRRLLASIEDFLAGGWPRDARRIPAPPRTPTPLAAPTADSTAGDD